MTQQKAHSTLGASSTHRWFHCPGSVELAKNFPNIESAYALEGTTAHTLAEICLKENKWPRDFWGTMIGDIKVTEEMADAVHVYVDYIRAKVKETKGKLSFERRFHLSFIDERLFGTNDACIVTPKGHLIVIDYKHGAGISVEAEANTQLLYYTLGAVWDPKEKQYHPYTSFENVIVQPRAEHSDGPIRSWKFAWPALLAFRRQLEFAVQEVDTNPYLKPGDHCRFCPALSQCPEVHKEAVSTAMTDFDSVPSVELLPPAKLAQIITYRSKLEKYLDAVEERALQLLLKGEKIDGLKLVRSRTNRKWESEMAVVKALWPKLGEEVYQERKVRTITDLEKFLGTDAIEGLTVKEEGKLVVAPMSDKRKDATPASADFN